MPHCSTTNAFATRFFIKYLTACNRIQGLETFNTMPLTIKKLFLIDGACASLTAVILFVILRTFHVCFGMPQTTLIILSIIALALSAYAISCFYFIKTKWHLFLLPLTVANLLYCCLTLTLIVYYYPQLTALGISYFLLEMAVICGLVFFEVHALSTSRKAKN